MEPFEISMNYIKLEDEMYALTLKYLREAWTKNSNVDAYLFKLRLLMHLYQKAGATEFVAWIVKTWDAQYDAYKSEGGRAAYRDLRS